MSSSGTHHGSGQPAGLQLTGEPSPPDVLPWASEFSSCLALTAQQLPGSQGLCLRLTHDTQGQRQRDGTLLPDLRLPARCPHLPTTLLLISLGRQPGSGEQTKQVSIQNPFPRAPVKCQGVEGDTR